jgi:hypothetical protein
MAKKPGGKQNKLLIYVLILITAFSFRVAIARFLPNDSPDDGRVYDQIARNVREKHLRRRSFGCRVTRFSSPAFIH